MQKDELKRHLTAGDTWLHGFFILLFAIAYSIAEILVVAVVVFQFLATLITGERNQRLLEFGQSLSSYMYQILRYVTFNSDERPYPFGDWPKGEPPAATAKPKAKRRAVSRKRKSSRTAKPADEPEEPPPAG